MERSLDLAFLRGALDGRSGLPTPDELQDLMAKAEIGLLLRRTEIDPELIQTAWYLHGVASVSQARQRYTLARQRQAFLVSAHIFDLALADAGHTREDRLSYAFAAAIGYRRGGRDPNATAIARRLPPEVELESSGDQLIGKLSLEVGIAFLGLDTRMLFRWLSNWRRKFAELAQESNLVDLSSTAFGPSHLMVLATEDLLSFLVRGNSERRDRANERLLSIVRGDAGPEDLNSRWVAAHLLNYAKESFAGSLWNDSVIPPGVTSLVREAFTTGSPAVITLWEPQRELLTGAVSPFDPDVHRMVLSVPTSGGKTLVAQLLAVEYLARTDRSICYVAPTRSLGREVRQAMSSRVRLLQKETGSEQPDFPSLMDFFSILDIPAETADVEVMTPERLSYMLRHDPDAVIDKFGMFIFDEAQLLKEKGRGFALESVIAALDLLTKTSDHQIVLISAAMGNSGAIAQWLSPEGTALVHESDWRGPRRLHAVFNTEAHWESTVVESGTGSVWPFRHTTELSGVVRVRTANGQTVSLATQGDTGWRLVRKAKDGAQRPSEVKKDPQSTKHYEIAADMVATLGHAGSVLVVASTKAEAQSLANALASGREESPEFVSLVDFVRLQLGPEHQLVDNLRHGVGFHHAGLPVEVLEALERAVRSDLLPFLTCTSTLTDGVNLPVRTVVLYDQSYPGQPEDSRLRGARLVNAIGRAGRAGKETEGWIVLVRAAAYSDQDFRDLSPDSDELAVMSSLLADDALDSAAELERQLRSNADAIFRADGAVGDFVSFVWMMLAIEEERTGDATSLEADTIVDATLLASQSTGARARYLRIANATLATYISADDDARRRWPRTGTSIGSSRTIDGLAQVLASTIVGGGMNDIATSDGSLRLLAPVLGELLALPEAPRWIFRKTIKGAEIHVEPERLLRDWMFGASLSDLANSHLADASPPAWRIEQMVSTATQQFEHYLSWTVGALVDLTNWHLDMMGHEDRLCPELPGFIRYGVVNSRSLQLMTSGIRSRRICSLVEAEIPEDLTSVDEMRSWLATMSIGEWQDRFHASSSEVLDLIEFTRTRRRSLLRALLENGTVTAAVSRVSNASFEAGALLALRPTSNDTAPAPLGVFRAEELVAIVGASDHADVQAILDTGLDVDLTFESRESEFLNIGLAVDDSYTQSTLL